MKVVAKQNFMSPANYDIKDRQPSNMDHWVVTINPYYTDLLTNIDSDSGMHFSVVFQSQHHRADLHQGGANSQLEKCKG